MRIRIFTLLSALVAFAAAQWPVTIPLDTFHPPFLDPAAMCFSFVSNHVYVSCSAYDGDTSVAVLDGSALERIAALGTGANSVNSIVCSQIQNKVYASSGGGVAVIDCNGDSIVTIIRNVPDYPRALGTNPLNGKVYVTSERYRVAAAIIDGDGDTVRAAVSVGWGPLALCTNTRDNKVYIANSCHDIGTWDSTITVIDGESDEVVNTIRVGLDPFSLIYARSLNRIYCANDGGWSRIDSTVSVIDGNSDSVIATIVVGLGARFLAYDSSLSKLYCGVRAGHITVIDCGANAVLRTIPVKSGGLVCDAPRHRLYSLNHLPNSVDVIDCLTDSVVAEVPTAPSLEPVCLNPSNGTFLVSSRASDDVTAYDAATRSVMARAFLGIQTPHAVVSLSDTPVVYVACGLNTVAAVSGRTNIVQDRLTVGMYPSALVYSPLSGHLYCANAGGDGFYPESTVSVIDPAQNRVLKNIVVGPGPSLLSYNDVEGKVYVAGRDMVVRTIDVRTDSVVHQATLDSLPQSMVYSSSCNKLFVTTLWGYRSGLWVIDGGLDTVVAHYCPTSACTKLTLGWNPDARKAYLFYEDKSYADFVAVWDAMADSVTKAFGLPLNVLSSAYDPTDSTLYVGRDGGVLWMIDGVGDSLIGKLVCAQCAGGEYLSFSPTTSRLYFTNASSANVGVVKGRSFVGRVDAGTRPSLAYICPINGMVYVANAGSGDLTAFPDTMFVGVRDSPTAGYPTRSLRPTIVSGKLLMPTPALGSAITYALVDVVGRQVTELRPGINDMGGLSPGVYFLKERRAGCNGISLSVGKVVVTR